MTEPPRPPGEGNPTDPTAPFTPQGTPPPTSGGGYTPPPAAPDGGYPPPYGQPTSGSPAPGNYGQPTSGSPAPGNYGQPTSGGPVSGGYEPPTSGGPVPGGYVPPTSGGPTSGGGYGPPPGGGYPPPAGGYPPPPGGPYGGQPYGAPGYGQPGGTTDDRTWVLVAHFGGAAAAFLLLSGWIPPLIAFLARGNTSPWVRAESVKALNFHILWSVVAVIGGILSCIGIGVVVTAAAWLIATIIGVIAGVKANNNEPYDYPLSVKIIK